MKIDWTKYILSFFITLAIFLGAILLSNYFSNKKLSQLQNIQDKIATDILSSEVENSLLEEESCTDVTNSVLSGELGSLADKITYSENNIGSSDELTSLKKNYSLLQIKDYLLTKKIAERCKLKFAFILYFYTTADDCTECVKQGYSLTELRNKYPALRVYSFDYDLDLSAIRALISVYKVPKELPALVINGKVYSGFKSVEDIEKIAPALKDTLPKEEKKAAAKITPTVSPSEQPVADTTEPKI